MSDFKSTKEIYEHLIAGGKVMSVDGTVFFLQEDGSLNKVEYFVNVRAYRKFIEPKPKVKLWQYAYKDMGAWQVSTGLYESDEFFKSQNPKFKSFQRIENSCIETDGE